MDAYAQWLFDLGCAEDDRRLDVLEYTRAGGHEAMRPFSREQLIVTRRQDADMRARMEAEYRAAITYLWAMDWFDGPFGHWAQKDGRMKWKT